MYVKSTLGQMKGNFQRFVQEGDLISFQFEQQPIRNVFGEILNLLAMQESRIDQITAQLPFFVLTSQIDAVRTETEQIKQKMGAIESTAGKALADTKHEFAQQMTEMKEYTDTANAGIMIDVKRYIDTEVKELLDAERANDQNARDITELNHTLSEMHESMGLLTRDIDAVKKEASGKLGEVQVRDMIQQELKPLAQQMEQLGNVQNDISSSRVHLRELGEQLDHLQKQGPVVIEAPAPPPQVIVVEKEVQKPEPVHEPTPEPEPKVEPPVETKPTPVVVPEPDPEPKVIQLPVIPPPLEDTASTERQLRRLNEMTNNFKFAIELLKETTQQNNDKIRQIQQQMNVKTISMNQEMDQLRAQIDRLKEQQVGGSVEVSGTLAEMKEEIAELRNTLSDSARSARDGRRNSAQRAEMKYADRALPRLDGRMDSRDYRDEAEAIPTQSSRLRSSIAAEIQARFEAQRMEDSDSYEEMSTPDDSGRQQKGKRDLQVRIIKQQSASRSQESPPSELVVPTITQEEIEEKVDKAIKMSIVGYLDRAKAETAKEIQNGLKVVDTIASKIDMKIDRDFVERMFNKFRVVVADLKDKIQQIQCTFMGWVTREELQEVLEKFVDQLADVNDTAVGSSKYKCLLCGKPRTHISGMIVGPGPDDFDLDDLESVTDAAKKIVRPRTGISSSKMTRRIARRTPPQPRDVVQLLTSDAARQ